MEKTLYDPRRMKRSFLLFSLMLFSLSYAQIYTVQSGDSLGKIAKKHGMTTAELIKLNNIKDPNKLAVGQKLRTAAAAAASSTVNKNASTYKITSGDTFYGIAKKYGMSIDQLKAANPNLDPSRLSIGQIIRLKPAFSSTSDPVAIAPPVQQAQVPAVPVQQPVQNPAPVQQAPIIKVVITEPILFREFAGEYGMTTAEVNKLNGWSYDENEIFDTGSVAFVIKN